MLHKIHIAVNNREVFTRAAPDSLDLLFTDRVNEWLWNCGAVRYRSAKLLKEATENAMGVFIHHGLDDVEMIFAFTDPNLAMQFKLMFA